MLDTVSTYIYTIYKHKSISLAAQELFISQPALSSALKREEEKLGFKIFNRKTIPLTLTQEGKQYIEALEKVLQIERESLDKIDDIRHANGGTLTIATATHLSYYVIPKVLKLFQSKYPQVDIHITMTDTNKLFELLDNDTVDVIFTHEAAPTEEFVTTVLFEERFVAAIPNQMIPPQLAAFAITHQQLLQGDYDAQKIISDVSLFHDLEFIYTPPKTTMHKKRRILFGKDDLPHYITSNAPRQQFNFNLMCAGFGAFLTTDANLATMQPHDSYHLFVISDLRIKQCFSVIAKPSENTLAANFAAVAQTLFGQDPLKELLTE